MFPCCSSFCVIGQTSVHTTKRALVSVHPPLSKKCLKLSRCGVNGMEIHSRHPIIPLVVGALLVTSIGAGIFGVWAVFDVIPSTVDNGFVETKCFVLSSKVTGEVSCPCSDDGLTCSDVYPCVEIMVNISSTGSETKNFQLYRDMRGKTFTDKCSYYPFGKACTGNATMTKVPALLFKLAKGRVGSNYTCYTDDLNNPTLVVSERNTRDIHVMAVFIVSLILFFVPTILLNAFFLYRWKFLAYLTSTIARHNRVAVAPPFDIDPMDRPANSRHSHRLKKLQFVEESMARSEHQNSSVIKEENQESTVIKE
ncbi:uncharacterized protein LOC116614455 [Nematostella vectensis]|uniref:uncharacterized protein LOC116614455 n=1 Tax=Nematostella vectensis TaxID=45351 RepID=UPI0020776A37|nr:uncharacterized protein LOC116614455 [Nematostella vectensis]